MFRIVVDHCSCKPAQWVGRQEFLVAPNVLALVYSQTVVWTGALFCPLLPFINTIKFILFYYCKKVPWHEHNLLRNIHAIDCNFSFCPCLLVSDNSLPELSTSNKKLPIHHLQLLLPVGSALRMDVGQRGSPLQRG